MSWRQSHPRTELIGRVIWNYCRFQLNFIALFLLLVINWTDRRYSLIYCVLLNVVGVDNNVIQIRAKMFIYRFKTLFEIKCLQTIVDVEVPLLYLCIFYCGRSSIATPPMALVSDANENLRSPPVSLFPLLAVRQVRFEAPTAVSV